MYGRLDEPKRIEDVLDYLYKQEKKDLADAVVELIRQNERVETYPCICPRAIGANPLTPNITYQSGLHTQSQC